MQDFSPINNQSIILSYRLLTKNLIFLMNKYYQWISLQTVDVIGSQLVLGISNIHVAITRVSK